MLHLEMMSAISDDSKKWARLESFDIWLEAIVIWLLAPTTPENWRGTQGVSKGLEEGQT